MNKITEYTNTAGVQMVLVEFEDGQSWSGFKSVWDEEQEAKENGTTNEGSLN